MEIDHHASTDAFRQQQLVMNIAKLRENITVLRIGSNRLLINHALLLRKRYPHRYPSISDALAFARIVQEGKMENLKLELAYYERQEEQKSKQ